MDREWRGEGMEKRKGEVRGVKGEKREGKEGTKERRENEDEINRREWITKE